MRRYLMKRVCFLVLTFFLITFLLFAVFCLTPGNPILYRYGEQEPQTGWQNFLTTSRTILSGYGRWMGLTPNEQGVRSGVLQGDFGRSYTYGRDALTALKPAMLNTIFINTLATAVTLAITIPLGIWCAVRFHKPADTAVQTLTLVGYSIPSYLITLIFIYVFAVQLGLFPAGGAKTPGLKLEGLARLLDRVYYLLLPVLCLVFIGMAGMTRVVRAAMVDSLSQDYIKTARAKGLKEKVVIYSHAWANALLPISYTLCGWIVSIFTGGSLVVEKTFNLWGTGTMFWEALNHSDFNMVLCIQVFYTIASLIGSLLTDIFYTFADPRVRLDK